MEDIKLSAYLTLREVLLTTSKLLALFIPFITEDIHVKLTGNSVHLADFPNYNEAGIDDQLEQEMERVLQVVELARHARNLSKIKTKQPLASLTVIGDKEAVQFLRKYEWIIKDEINVKHVYLGSDLEDQVHYEVKLNFSTAGPKLGKRTGLLQKQLQQLSDESIVEMVKGDCKLTLPSGESLLLDEEDLIVKQVTKAGVEMAANQPYTVLLDMVITKELEQEGLARELIRAVQLYRKELHLPVDKRVCITFDVSDPIKDVIKQFQDLLTTNLLISDLKFGETAVMKTVEIDGESIRLGID
ncbi:DUF5915 domain-containing protein [Cerasibacillus sp. JNUCC 74]